MTKILTIVRSQFKKNPPVLNDHNHKMTWDDIFCLLLILVLYIYHYEKIENAIERLFERKGIMKSDNHVVDYFLPQVQKVYLNMNKPRHDS